ncbi:MAG: hypothetical protein K6C94_00775 [Candidatus Gastranaerophilales bacterium]|nr:hypothetical protein [Candidatus Gastranaerophilales bacterium]
MDNKDIVKKISAKDESAALPLIREMIDKSDVALFRELVGQFDYFFPFLKDNVANRFEKSLSADNYRNLYNFAEIYSSDLDKVFASAFKNFGNDDDKAKMLEYLKNGTESAKTYAARYFELSGDEIAVQDLIDNVFSENEYLADACAAALGNLNEQKSYALALDKLKSSDDFEALAGLNFFVSYLKNPPFDDIFKAFKTTGMPENFAGKIAYIKPLPVLLKENISDALPIIDSILIGLGEILPLSEVFNFELYDVLGMLSETVNSENLSKIAVILLRAKSKIEMICSNDEYTFDEDKNTINELKDIRSLLNSLGDAFWNTMKSEAVKELKKEDKSDIISALQIIGEYEIQSAAPDILDCIYENGDEVVLCEAFSALKKINALYLINKDEAVNMFSNSNSAAIVENLYNS